MVVGLISRHYCIDFFWKLPTFLHHVAETPKAVWVYLLYWDMRWGLEYRFRILPSAFPHVLFWFLLWFFPRCFDSSSRSLHYNLRPNLITSILGCTLHRLFCITIHYCTPTAASCYYGVGSILIILLHSLLLLISYKHDTYTRSISHSNNRRSLQMAGSHCSW